MQIAIQNPIVWLGKNSLHPYVGEFILKYKPILYFNRPKFYAAFLYRFAKAYGLPALLSVHRPVFDVAALNRTADSLVCFNGTPENKIGAPPSDFKGKKFFHVMDYFCNCAKRNKALEDGKVDFLFGYTDHFRHDAFFRKHYPRFGGRVIGVPFGFGKRFAKHTPFGLRHNKCVALGSITPFIDQKAVDEGRVSRGNISYDGAEFFKGEKYIQKFRFLLRERETELHPVLDSFMPGSKVENLYLPAPSSSNSTWAPKKAWKLAGKRWDYDLVDVLNQYRMFTQCETLFQMPLGKAYEGCAAGSALVCSDGEWYSELGFKDGVNCLRHKLMDVGSFQDKVEWGLKNTPKLEKIAGEGRKMVLEKFSPSAIARLIYTKASSA